MRTRLPFFVYIDVSIAQDNRHTKFQKDAQKMNVEEDMEDMEDMEDVEDEEDEEDSEEDEDEDEEDEEDDSGEGEDEEEDTDDDLNDDLNDGTRRRRIQNVPGTERRHRHADEEDESDEDEDAAIHDDVVEDAGRGGGANNTDDTPGANNNDDNDVPTNEEQRTADNGDNGNGNEQQTQHATSNREAQEADKRADTFHDKAHAAKRNVREIGDEAVWSVTSSKPGNGVELLRDGNLKTYWQSDGAQPHFINCQFQKKANVCEVAIYTNYKQDESYTPSKIVIRAGNSYRDLKDVATKTLNEPHGWQRVRTTRLDKEKLKDIQAHYGSKKQLKNSGMEYLEKESCEAPIRAFFIQICILQNHQNGRDTHVRQVHIYSPAGTPASDGPRARFRSSEYARYAVVR